MTDIVWEDPPAPHSNRPIGRPAAYVEVRGYIRYIGDTR